jgi:hypothetical protein
LVAFFLLFFVETGRGIAHSGAFFRLVAVLDLGAVLVNRGLTGAGKALVLFFFGSLLLALRIGHSGAFFRFVIVLVLRGILCHRGLSNLVKVLILFFFLVLLGCFLLLSQQIFVPVQLLLD